MLRSLSIRSSIHQTMLNKVFKISDCVHGPCDFRKSMLFSSCLYTSNNFQENLMRLNNCNDKGLISLNDPRNKKDCALLYMHTSNKSLQEIKLDSLDVNKAQRTLYKMKMNDLKDAPPSAFWIGFAGLMPLVFPPLQSIIFGYSPSLATLQLAYGTAILSFVGGCKWGYLVPEQNKGTWENYAMSITPCLIATLSMVTPTLLAYPLVMFGLLGTFFLDLTSSNYPKWFLSLRGVLTNISVFFLLISFFQALLHFK